VPLDDLRQWPERHAVSVGETAPAEYQGAVAADPLEELSRQTALAHTGVPVHGHKVWLTLCADTFEDAGEQIQLGAAADDRRCQTLDPALGSHLTAKDPEFVDALDLPSKLESADFLLSESQ